MPQLELVDQMNDLRIFTSKSAIRLKKKSILNTKLGKSMVADI